MRTPRSLTSSREIGIPRADTKFIVVCGTGTMPQMDVSARDLAWLIEKSKKTERCPYHFVIRRNGKVDKGRALTMRAHVWHGFNAISVGIALAGGLHPEIWSKTGDFYEPAQKAALAVVVRDLLARYPGVKVVAQDELGFVKGRTEKRINPGFNVQIWLAEVGLKHFAWWQDEHGSPIPAQYGERASWKP